MRYTRRDFGKLALAAAPAATWVGDPRWAVQAAGQTAKPNSTFGGVQIGAVSYCFRQISYNPEDVLKGMVFLGLNTIELEQSFFERYLGAPPESDRWRPAGRRGPRGGGRTVRRSQRECSAARRGSVNRSRRAAGRRSRRRRTGDAGGFGPDRAAVRVPGAPAAVEAAGADK